MTIDPTRSRNFEQPGETDGLVDVWQEDGQQFFVFSFERLFVARTAARNDPGLLTAVTKDGAADAKGGFPVKDEVPPPGRNPCLVAWSFISTSLEKVAASLK